MRDEICSRVCQAAASAWNLKPEQINKDSTMESILKWDSLGHLKLVMALEEEFGITLRPKDTVRMRSIEKICQIIEASKSHP